MPVSYCGFYLQFFDYYFGLLSLIFWLFVFIVSEFLIYALFFFKMMRYISHYEAVFYFSFASEMGNTFYQMFYASLKDTQK